MTINSKGTAGQYITANGGSTYTFSFQPFLAETGSQFYGVKVYVWDGQPTSQYIEKVQGAGADFTVSVTSSAAEAGQIVFSVPVTAGHSIFVRSGIPLTQIVSFPANAPVSPADVEKALDRLEMQIRQLDYALTETIRIQFPNVYNGIKLLVDANVSNGHTVYWEKDASDPQLYTLKTSDFSIAELKTLTTTIDQVKQDVEAALVAARAANDSAIIAANNAAASAQAATNTINALQQIQTDVQIIKGQVNDLLVQTKAAQTATEQLKAETNVLKVAAEAAKTAAEQAKTDVQTIVARYPDPTGLGKDLVMVTDTNNKFTLQPYQYFSTLIGAKAGQKLVTDGANSMIAVDDRGIVQNLDTASSGDVLTINTSPSGNVVVATPYVSSTSTITTVKPLEEGGVTVRDALSEHERRLDALEAQANPYPFGQDNVIMDLRVLGTGILRNNIDQYVVAPTSAVHVRQENIGKSAQFTTDSNYTIPNQKDGKDILKEQTSILFTLYVDSTFTIPAALLQNSNLVVEINTTNMIVRYGTATVNVPLTLNEWRSYCLSFNGLTLSIYEGAYIPDNMVITEILPKTTLTTKLVNDEIRVSAEPKIRLAALTIVSAAITKDDFEENSRFVFGLSKASGANALPDPSSGKTNQALVIVGSSYGFKFPILFSNIPTGYTVQNTIDATIELSRQTEYSLYFTVDNTNKIINVAVRDSFPAISIKTTFFSGTASATPSVLALKDPKVKLRTIQNLSSADIVIGSQADLTANALKGYTLVSQTSIQTSVNDAIFMTAPAGSVINANEIKVVDEVATQNQPIITARTIIPTGTPGTAPILLTTKDDNVKERLVQNLAKGDIVIGSQADLTTDPEKGYTVVAFNEGSITIANEDIYMTMPNAVPVVANEIKVFEQYLGA